MNESKIRTMVVSALRRFAAFAVENSAHDGAPDVACVLGWVELKRLDACPVHGTSQIGVDLRPSQELWLRRWTHAGGRAVVLTVVGDEWFLHDGAWAAMHLATATVNAFRASALRTWRKRPGPNTLAEALEQALGQRTTTGSDDAGRQSENQHE